MNNTILDFRKVSLGGNFLLQQSPQVILAGTLTGVQGDIWCKVLAALSTVRLCRDTCFYVCPQTWLNEARTDIGLSPTMGFLNENDSLAYFAILGELSSGLSTIVGFFKTVSFISL